MNTAKANDKKTAAAARRVLDAILTDWYGVGPLHASDATVLWAAARQARESGLETARIALRSLNAERERLGKCLVDVPYRYFESLGVK